MEYKVELLKSTIKKLNITVDLNEQTSFQVQTQNAASVYEPNDESDPTVMIRTDCKMRDTTNDQLSIDMTVEMIFKIEPLPENRVDVASYYCREMITEELSRLATALLRDMGHKIALS